MSRKNSDNSKNLKKEIIFGKDFNYTREIPDLSRFKIGSYGTFAQLNRNIDGLSKYSAIALEGPPMGVNYFLYTGKCKGEPDDGEKMYKYVRNIPSGDSVFGASMKGIVPGIAEDMDDLNPLNLVKTLFSTPKKKSLSDYDKKTKSNCKKIRRLSKVCKFDNCKNVCEEKRVSVNYDECADFKKEPHKWTRKKVYLKWNPNGSVFCSESDRNKLRKKCEGFTDYKKTIEHYKNLKDTNYLTVIIITIMILLFTYFLINLI